MRTFIYIEPDEDFNPITKTITDKEILRFYWDYWKSQMGRVGKQEYISEQNCVDDFCVIYWATEITTD